MNDREKASGDLGEDVVRDAAHRVADMVTDYLSHVDSYDVLPRIAPGDVRRLLPDAPPRDGESLDAILNDYESIIVPNVTHWNHPGFMAWFAITGSAPGVLAETLAAALNLNGMLWRSSPAFTELEELVCDWVRQMMGLPEAFIGHINDTASMSTLLALAAARHRLTDGRVRTEGLVGLPRLTMYTSKEAHSSVEKAVIALGHGSASLRYVETDEELRMQPAALAEAVRTDREAGAWPTAVIATLGTTSTTAIDPAEEIASICEREHLWLHIDSAYAGSAAICPELRALMPGMEHADSIVVNPHKWLFTPVDCSLLYLKEPEMLKDAFSIVPAYLKTDESGVTNLMDYGVQLGRRFRALKLWMVIRAFGVEGLQARIREHCEMARELAASIDASSDFDLVAPVRFSLVCLRARGGGEGEESDRLNNAIIDAVNRTGRVFLGSTKVGGRLAIRVAIGNLRTTRDHVREVWTTLQRAARTVRST